MQMLKHKADFLYVGTSGAIQPTLPTIVANAKKMHLPIFNADAAAVKNHQVLASFGVDYYKIGINVGKIIARLLQGEPITNIQPYYPSLHDHHGFISKKQLEIFGLQLPTDLKNITVVE